MKAWIVRENEGEGCCMIVFADTPGKARRRGIDELSEFGYDRSDWTGVSVQRRPKLDGREANPPDMQELVEQHGWSTACCECERPITDEGANRHFYDEDDGPEFEPVVWNGPFGYCASCVPDRVRQRMADAKESGA